MAQAHHGTPPKRSRRTCPRTTDNPGTPRDGTPSGWRISPSRWSRREDQGVKPGARRSHHLLRVRSTIRCGRRARPADGVQAVRRYGAVFSMIASSSEGSRPLRRPARRRLWYVRGHDLPVTNRRHLDVRHLKRTAGGRDHTFVVPLGNHDSGVGGLMDDHVVGPQSNRRGRRGGEVSADRFPSIESHRCCQREGILDDRTVGVQPVELFPPLVSIPRMRASTTWRGYGSSMWTTLGSHRHGLSEAAHGRNGRRAGYPNSTADKPDRRVHSPARRVLNRRIPRTAAT